MIIKIDNAETFKIPPGSKGIFENSFPQWGVKKSFKDNQAFDDLRFRFFRVRTIASPKNLLKIKIGDNVLLEHVDRSNVFPKYLKW